MSAQKKGFFFQTTSPNIYFSSGGQPTSAIFGDLTDSITFFLESGSTADTAQVQQGLTLRALASDINSANDTKDIGFGPLALSVSPSQMSTFALTGGTITATPASARGGILYTFPSYAIANDTDVVLTSLTSGQILVYNGSDWINGNITYQTIASNITTNATQRPILNFGTDFTVTDDVGNTCTTVHIANNAITYAKIQATSQTCFLGSSGSGAVAEQTLHSELTLSGGVLSITSYGITYGSGGMLQKAASAYVLLGNPTSGSTYNVEITLGTGLSFSGGALILTTGAIAYTKLSNTAGGTSLLGNVSGAGGAVNEVNVVGFALVNTMATNYDIRPNILKTVTGATYSVIVGDFNGAIIVFTHTSSGAVTVTMPNPASVLPGLIVRLKDNGNAGTHNITIGPYSGETLDGASTYVISANYGKVAFFTDGTNWFTV